MRTSGPSNSDFSGKSDDSSGNDDELRLEPLGTPHDSFDEDLPDFSVVEAVPADSIDVEFGGEDETAVFSDLTPTAIDDHVSPLEPTADVFGGGEELIDASTEEGYSEQHIDQSLRRRFFLSAVPSWLISLLVHAGLLVVLGAITLDPVQQVISILQASATAEESEVIDEFDIQGPSLESSEMKSDPLEFNAPTVSEVTMPEIASPLMTSMEVDVDVMETNAITESIIPSALLNTSALAQMTAALNSRSLSGKSEMLEKFGGTAASEKAVANALKWIASHQHRDGGWSFGHNAICRNPLCKDPGDMVVARNGATAMALLPFLGAGQTHVEGQYKETVHKGLAFLINRLDVAQTMEMPIGSWHEDRGRFYSHALAAITVCEAYAMTDDPDLVQPAQLALNYIIRGQNKRDGGWRYKPGDRGDTSVVGWCLMALKSGKMGNLFVPPATFRGVDGFLDFVSSNNGAYYGYTGPTAKLEGREATIAVGLLCRMYLGHPKEHPGLQAGIEHLHSLGPRMSDLYYCYYATQVMRHNGGPMWDAWNKKMRDSLIQSQESEGHMTGSWHMKGRHSGAGGRLYSTSLATMILEVYYRHMPLYSEKSSDDDFEI